MEKYLGLQPINLKTVFKKPQKNNQLIPKPQPTNLKKPIQKTLKQQKTIEKLYSKNSKTTTNEKSSPSYFFWPRTFFSPKNLNS